ncbi:hypothetical protein [Nostoc sp.]
MTVQTRLIASLMTKAAGRLSLYRHLGMEFPAAFNEDAIGNSQT